MCIVFKAHPVLFHKTCRVTTGLCLHGTTTDQPVLVTSCITGLTGDLWEWISLKTEVPVMI